MRSSPLAARTVDFPSVAPSNSNRGRLTLQTEGANDDAPAVSPVEEVGVSFHELGRMIERGGPLPADRAVSILRKAACALARAEVGRRCPETGNYVFWLGAVLFFALTGKAPLAPATAGGTPPLVAPPVSSLAPYPVPAVLDNLVRTCLAVRASDRYPSVIELSAALWALPYAEESDDEAMMTNDDRNSEPPPSGIMCRDRVEIGHRRHRRPGRDSRLSDDRFSRGVLP